MAEIVFTAVINKAVEISSNALFNELPSDSSLRENIRWIETEMRRMRSYLADTEAKEISSHGVANLINDIEQLAEDVEIVLYTYLSEIASHREGECRLQCLKEAARIFSCHGHTAHKLVARVEEIKRKVADIDASRRRYNITDSSSNNKDEIFSTSDQRRSFLHVDESEIIGLEKDCEELETKLLDTNLEFDVISIIGMGGLGKTTLAKRVYKQVKCHFDCSALVSVFQEPRSNVLHEVAKQVGLGKDKMKQNLEINLYTFLKEKRYVIFLDDVWSKETWNALSSNFPIFDNSKTGSRIIITSRKIDIGRYIGGESSIHKLQPLKPEDSWKLFVKVLLRASTDNKSGIPTNLEGIGRELMGRCDGLPLAIVLTASLLRAKEESEHDWNRVLKNMRQNHEQDLGQCSKILGLSYKDLSVSLKPCFLYFALFPEDYEIPVFDLINMWAAEKFITRSGESEIEEVGEFYLNDLVARNLIQVSKRRYDGKIKTCRIHNMLHDLCIRVAKGKKFFHSLNDIVGTAGSSCVEGPRRLAVHKRDADKYLSCHLETPKIYALLSFEPIKVPKNQKVKNIFQNAGFLRVLNLEISASPDKYGWSVIGPIGKLIHLSYLRLRGFSDTCLPSSISNLKYLLTLDVRGCDSIRLPTCIWKMEQLRHLQIGALSLFVRFCVGYWGFEESDIVTKHYPIEVNLPNIQTLETMDVCYWNPKWLCKVGPSIRRLAVSGASRETITVLNNQNNVIFEKLENLRLSNDTTHVISSGDFTLSGYPNLLKVHLDVFFSSNKLPSSEHFPPNLIKLTLLKNRLTEDPLQTLNKLPKLKILKLDSDCYIGKTMDCDGGFCQLEVLRIRGLDNLEELMMDGVGNASIKKSDD